MNSTILSPKETVAAVVKMGEGKAARSAAEMLILGFLAGACIAFAGFSSAMGSFSLLEDPTTFSAGKCILGGMFTVGLIMVVLTGAELFTGNSLMILACAEKKISSGAMLKNWVIVYFANMLGTFAIVGLLMTNAFFRSENGTRLGVMLIQTAITKVSMGTVSAFCSAILCNWLVCTAVWLSACAKTAGGKIAAIIGPVWLFATAGFEHSIANMFYIPMGLILKANYYPYLQMCSGIVPEAIDKLNISGYLVGNLIPVTLGNIVGGVFFVALALWYCNRGEKPSARETQD